jgi:uncharacterized protein (TIGR02996 family)
MTHPDRLALLRAIALAPDDDAPRLVYADWLDEFGTTDADRARAEFIRVACKGKAKSRQSPAEGKWLDAHGPRLLPAVAARLEGTGRGWKNTTRSGRYLAVWAVVVTPERGTEFVYLRLEFWRGFVRRAVYGQGYEAFADAVAADEPLAGHAPEHVPPPLLWPDGSIQVPVRPNWAGGEAVWDRVTGQTDDRPADRLKWFRDPDGSSEGIARLQARVTAAVAAAMTAEARHRAGWPADLPALG